MGLRCFPAGLLRKQPAVDAAATGRGRVRFERLSAVVRYVTIETVGGECHALAGNGSAAMRGGETGAFPVARSRKPTGLRAWEGGGGGLGTPLRFTRRFTSRPGTRAGFISTLMSQLEAAGLPPLLPASLLPERARSAH